MMLLGRVWRRILAPAFWAFVILGGATIGLFAFTGADDVIQLILNDPSALNEMTDAEIGELGLTLLQAGLVVVVAQLLAGGFVNMAVHRIVADEMAGEVVGAGEASSRALGRLPTLVVSAAEDRIARLEYGKELASLIPRARFVEVAEAGHAVTIQRADEINALLLEHLGARAAAGSAGS